VLPEKGWPTLLVPADLEKGHTDRILPIAPEFAMLLQETPIAQRKGFVFALTGTRCRERRPQPRRVSEIVSEIGKKAGVVVRVDSQDPAKVKFASPHDFRRAFGERWAARLMPAQLQELMRHESIETTLRYYVGRNAERTAEACWEAFERASGRVWGHRMPFGEMATAAGRR
jgi:integrase